MNLAEILALIEAVPAAVGAFEKLVNIIKGSSNPEQCAGEVCKHLDTFQGDPKLNSKIGNPSDLVGQ